MTEPTTSPGRIQLSSIEVRSAGSRNSMSPIAMVVWVVMVWRVWVVRWSRVVAVVVSYRSGRYLRVRC
ncbi:hypothetical protein ABZ540_36625, partial [Nocardia xishanensis]